MSSRIEQMIDELEEYIESCKPKFMSSTEIIVNKEEIDELLRELRMKTPEEIKRYQKIIQNTEEIMANARAKAQAMIDEATVQTHELISEHEIMQQAYAQANEIITTAAGQAQDILDRATMEANELRMQAAAYTEARLAELETIISSAIEASTANYEVLLGSLGQYRDVIQDNIRAFHPTEEYFEEIPLEGSDESDDTEGML